jgi:hypothetical protein
MSKFTGYLEEQLEMPAMFRMLLLVSLAFSLLLAACAPGVQAHPPEGIQSPDPTSDLTFLNESEAGELHPTPDPNPEGSHPGTFATSLLVTEWNESTREHRLYLVDPGSGQPLSAYPPISLGSNYAHAFSPDRSTLAIATSRSLFLINLLNWEVRTFDLQTGGNVSNLAFDPQARRLAIAYSNRENSVVIFSLDQETITAQIALDFLPVRLNFTADGRGAMVYGKVIENRFTANEMSAGPAWVALLDAIDLSLSWSAELDGVRDGIYPQEEASGEHADLHQPGAAIYLVPGLAFAPHGDLLYVVHPDQDKLTTVDFIARQVVTREIHTPLTWFERLLALTAGTAHAKVVEGTVKKAVISPDGQYLYVVGLENTLEILQTEGGEWDIARNPLGLQVIRLADGSRLSRIDTLASELSISPDGRVLYLSGWGEEGTRTEVFNVSRREVVARLEGMLRPALRMDGKSLLVSSDWIGDRPGCRMRVADPRSLTVLGEWTGYQCISWLSSP